MLRISSPDTSNRSASLLVAVTLALIALVAFDAPVRAAAEATPAEVVAAMETAGLECITHEAGYVLCDQGAECGFGADDPSDHTCHWNPDDGPVMIAEFWSDPALSGPVSIANLRVSYSDETVVASDALGAKDAFLTIIDRLCPGAADAASGWFSTPTENAAFPGDGCEARLTNLSGDAAEGGTQDFHLGFGTVGSVPVASPSPLASVTTASVAPSASAGAVIASATPSQSTGAAAVAPPPAVGPSSRQIAAPGGFVASVATPATVSVDPTVAVQSAVLAIVVLLLMPFPAQLFNSTFEQNRGEIESWFAPLRRALRMSGNSIGQFWRSPAGIGLFFVGSAVLYALLDPGSTLSAEGFITTLGILVGLVIVTLLFATPAILWHRRIGDRPVIEAIPLTIVVGIGCVVISRIVDFQPGYLYGLIIGLGFARELDPKGEGRSGATAALLMLMAAFVAWIGLGALIDIGAQGFLAAIVETVLAVVLVAGLEGVAFGLLPIRFLPGEPVYAWNRIIWAALIGLGLFAFFHILINPQSGYMSDTSRTPLLTVVALLVGFGVLSIAFWGYFRYRPLRSAT